uniref:Cysteine-rich venom protein 3 n=1 Tax=Pimpla hypochondriaca TaxID=135724 RepID=CVP3_PIMHY|nr:RecName: Full=Cysteine-rich venom protein 3; Short=cvp3; Flags: Precursor [Pimpla hypochondriaca]CAD27739.1 cysteine-rich venom protein 3 [Pimpla hypochondriaca]
MRKPITLILVVALALVLLATSEVSAYRACGFPGRRCSPTEECCEGLVCQPRKNGPSMCYRPDP